MEYGNTDALLVVDVQNDFAHPEGSLYVAGGEITIPFINDQVAAAHDAGATIVYTQDWHPPSTPHFAKDGGIWPVHCVMETWGAELHQELTVYENAPRVTKGEGGEDGYSAFAMLDPATGERTSTGLAGLLQERGVDRVIIVGLATDYCVKSTALDAIELFPTTVLADGIAAVNLAAGDGARAVAAMITAGAELV